MKRSPDPLVVDGVTISHPDKVLFPDAGYTKRDLVEYYRLVAPYLLPFIADRPLTLRPFPHGIDRPGYYRKDAPATAPAWIRTWRDIAKSTGRPVDYVVAGDLRTLLWIADQDSIEVHPWLSRIDAPDQPDWLVFDLDPAKGVDFDRVRAAATLAKQRLDELGLQGLLKTSGQTGLHVLIPIKRGPDFETARAFVRQFAQTLEREAPSIISSSYTTAHQQGRVHLDYAQNSYGRTTVAPYSVRPRPGAPVSAPLEWTEIDDPSLRPDQFTIGEMPARLERLGDLLGPFLDLEQELP